MGKLEEYREQLSNIDRELAQLFLKRIKITKKIGHYKKEQSLDIFQPEREKVVIEKMRSLTTDKAEKEFLETFFHCLMNLSKEAQR